MMQLNFNPFPVLHTQRLKLRQVKETDAERLFILRSDERVMKYLDRPGPGAIAEILELIGRITNDVENNRGITWAITLKGEDSLIGTIGYWKVSPENFRAEIGYLLDPGFQHQGIMNEALVKVIDFGLANMHLHSIAADVNPANKSSIKLLERNNFVREGYLRENYYYEGHFIDTAMYALVNDGV